MKASYTFAEWDSTAHPKIQIRENYSERYFPNVVVSRRLLELSTGSPRRLRSGNVRMWDWA